MHSIGFARHYINMILSFEKISKITENLHLSPAAANSYFKEREENYQYKLVTLEPLGQVLKNMTFQLLHNYCNTIQKRLHDWLHLDAYDLLGIASPSPFSSTTLERNTGTKFLHVWICRI